jgi:hypothetical protein
MSQVENGLVSPSIGSMAKIADALACIIHEAFGNKDVGPPQTETHCPSRAHADTAHSVVRHGWAFAPRCHARLLAIL